MRDDRSDYQIVQLSRLLFEWRKILHAVTEILDQRRQFFFDDRRSHRLNAITRDHPGDQFALGDEVFDQRHIRLDHRLQFIQRNRFHRHKIRYLRALLFHLNEQILITGTRVDQLRLNFFDLFFTLGIGQPFLDLPDDLFLICQRVVHALAHIVLQAHFLIAQKINEASGLGAFGIFKRSLHLARIEKKQNEFFINVLLVGEESVLKFFHLDRRAHAVDYSNGLLVGFNRRRSLTHLFETSALPPQSPPQNLLKVVAFGKTGGLFENSDS